MTIKDITLKSTNNKSFMKIFCNGLIIGSLKRISLNEWILYPELPNSNIMQKFTSKEESLKFISDRLVDFINIIKE
jgi:hypothetical protein